MKKIKNVKRKVVSIVATSMCLIMAVPSVAFAENTGNEGMKNPTGAKGTVTEGTVNQSIDSSNYYYWTDLRNVNHKDDDIYGRVIKGDNSKWGYIWDRDSYSQGYTSSHVSDLWSGVGSNNNGWWYINNGWVEKNVDGYGVLKGLPGGDEDTNNNTRSERFTKLLDSWANTVTTRNLWVSIDPDNDNSLNRVLITNNDTVLQNSNGWFYVVDGAVNFSFDGLAANENGGWYCDDGSVDFTKTAIVTDSYGNLSTDKSAEYYVINGKVQEGAGEDIVKVNGTWYHMENGAVLHQETVAKNANGWYYCNSQGRVDWTFTGIAQNSNGWWYIDQGSVNWNKNGTVYVNSNNVEVDEGSSSATKKCTVVGGEVTSITNI